MGVGGASGGGRGIGLVVGEAEAEGGARGQKRGCIVWHLMDFCDRPWNICMAFSDGLTDF